MDHACSWSRIGRGDVAAGGRNVTIALQTRTGHTRMAPIVGLLLATQFWYWYPLINMLSLAFTPTAVIGLNKDHQVRGAKRRTAHSRPISGPISGPK